MQGICYRPVCWLLIASIPGFASLAAADEPSPLERVRSYDLDVIAAEHVTVYYDPDDRETAVRLSALGENAATFIGENLGMKFHLSVAALSPERWFTRYPGQPYGIPWNSMSECLVIVPSSLEDGMLFRGRPESESRRLQDYLLLHEYGHLIAKRYFRPASTEEYLGVSWFEELLANYFAYSYVATTDPAWSATLQRMWVAGSSSFTPAVLSLDWSFMNDLPPPEVARTYDWYQKLINLRAARLFERHGIAFLSTLKKGLSWKASTEWTTDSVLSELEAVSPGFRHWSEHLGEGIPE